MVDWKKKSNSKRKPVEAIFNRVEAGGISRDGKKAWSRINITVTLPFFKDTEIEMDKALEHLSEGDNVLVNLGAIQGIEKKREEESESSSHTSEWEEEVKPDGLIKWTRK